MDARSIDNGSKASDAQNTVGIGLVFRAMRRRPVLFLLFILLAAGAGTAIWTYLPLPKMTGYSIFQIKAQPDFITQAAGDAKIEFNLYRSSQTALIKSRLVLNAAISQPEVSNLPILRNEPNAINWLENQLKIDFKMGPELMKVAIEGDNPDELKTIMAAITESYLKDVVNKDKAKRLARLEQLTKVYRKYDETMQTQRKRIRALAETLATSEPHAAAVREKYIQEEIGICRKELSQLERDVLRAKSDMQYYQSRIEAAEEIPVSKDSIDSALVADPYYQRLQEKGRVLELGIENLKSTLVNGVSHPSLIAKEKELVDTQKEISAYAAKVSPLIHSRIRDQIISRETQLLADLKFRTGSNETFQATLDKHMITLESKIKNFKVNQVDLETLKAEIGQTERMTDRLMTEMESMKPELETTGRVSVWEDPVVVPGIEGNRRLKYTMMASLGIMFVGLSLLTGLEYRGRRLNRTDEVVARLGLRVIGTVPALMKKSRGAVAVGSPGWQSHLLEAVDNTRTLLLGGLDPTKSIRTIMITSALSGEGKTSLSGHLAVSLARAGFKTLLVDADMRRPSLHRVLGVPLSAGLSDLLRNEASIDQVIRATPAPRLSVIPAGLFHPNLPQILAGNAWRDLKVQLEAEYDYIVVDTPPLLPVADTLLLAKHVDGVVLALLHDVSRMGAVEEAKDRLAVVGTNILGVVINGVNGENYGNSYGYYYYRRSLESSPPSATA